MDIEELFEHITKSILRMAEIANQTTEFIKRYDELNAEMGEKGIVDTEQRKAYMMNATLEENN